MGVSFKFFTLDEFKQKYFEKEMEQYESILPDNRDEMIAVCRYFHWNKDKIESNWFEDQDNLRLKIGMDYDKSLITKYPTIDGSLAKNNNGLCSTWGEPFDEDDPEMKAISLVCGH